MRSLATRFTAKRPPSISGSTRSMTARTRPSACVRLRFRTAGLGSLAFMLEKHRGERRQRYANRMIPPVRGDRVRAHAAIVSDAAPAVVGRVRIEQLAPPAFARHADEVILARHRREVADDENDVLGV